VFNLLLYYYFLYLNFCDGLILTYSFYFFYEFGIKVNEEVYYLCTTETKGKS